MLSEKILKIALTLGIAGIFSLPMTVPALGAGPSIDTGKLLKQSNLVFEGKVTEIRYKNSIGDSQHPKGLPFTFVTYKVINRLRGESEDFFTVRFFGGAHPDGTYMQVGSPPRFDVGDHDILLIDGNTKKACPLVNCIEGRFRIINDRIYTENGQTIISSGQNLQAGVIQELSQVVGHTIEHPVTGKKVLVETKGSVMAPQQPEPDHFKAGPFTDYIRKIVRTLPAPTISEKPAHINEDFIGYLIRAVSVRPGPVARPDRPETPEEEIERRAFEANNGNPVLPE